MVSLQITITRAYEKLKVRRFAEQVRAALKVGAEFWNDEFLPRHFQSGAVQRYRYAARTAGTLARKAREAKKGRPNLPLVFRGDYERAALTPIAAKKVTAVATSARQKVRVKVDVPHKMRIKNQGEGVRLNDEELRQMQRVAARELTVRVKEDLRTKGARKTYGRK